MKKEEIFVLTTIVAVLLIALYRYNSLPHKTAKRDTTRQNRPYTFQKELNNDEATIEYIKGVIINGSNHLGFQKGGMQGGFVPKSNAKDVACYVYELSGKKCKIPYSKDAALLFSSNCAGCHGNDGKGLNGHYPNLTRQPLLGLKK